MSFTHRNGVGVDLVQAKLSASDLINAYDYKATNQRYYPDLGRFMSLVLNFLASCSDVSSTSGASMKRWLFSQAIYIYTHTHTHTHAHTHIYTYIHIYTVYIYIYIQYMYTVDIYTVCIQYIYIYIIYIYIQYIYI